ncbi:MULTISPECIES: LysR family transcriptional regulator [Dyella]|uniref:LysR family transcriptional regulator n=2 Tax=Dyella TaxID=231454 RepID=A0A4V2NKT3_9GAMM|nr:MULTISPECIES: LysR family transcriptional regulator [Dyella]TBR36333.1 LysR family transcriptional regulator [Dyella terrae]TCI05990.1 LysR family transcriptional regulator [Dyella soli]
MKTSLDELQTFITVVDAGSITAAAERLGQTVSGISRALRRLEDKLDTTLLRRTTRRIELTEEGRFFLERARQILAAVDDAEDEMSARRQKPAGRLRVNAASPFMLHVIVPLVGGFRARFPEIELELNSSDQIIDLLEQRTDVAIRMGSLRDSTLHARPLGLSRLRVLASPAYLKARGTPRHVRELGKHSLLGFSQTETLNDWPLRHSQGDSLRIKPSLLASSGETIRHLAIAGEGIACLADFMTAQDQSSGALVPVLTRDTVDVRQPIHAVYYRNTQLASRIRCFVDYVAEVMDEAGAPR